VVTDYVLLHRYSTWHHSHPTLVERLKALEKLKLQAASTTSAARKKEL